MNIWNGIVSAKVNALIQIKRLILSHHLSKDLKAGRDIACAFTSIYLSNPSLYQETYHLVEPFGASDYLNFQNKRTLVKALLYSDS